MKFKLKTTHVWGIILLLTLSVYLYRIYAIEQDLKAPEMPDDALTLASESQELPVLSPHGSLDTDSTQLPPTKSETWKKLMDIEYEKISTYGYIPVFKDVQKEMDGSVITIEGFMYPLEETPKQTIFILSFYPIASCFFCGGAGPESVVEVNAPNAIKYSRKQVSIKGRLELNEDEPERLFYILQDAELAR